MYVEYGAIIAALGKVLIVGLKLIRPLVNLASWKLARLIGELDALYNSIYLSFGVALFAS